MHIINITVRDKIATYVGDAYYVCGNSDFVVHFDFDEEWSEHETRTARFIFGGSFEDVVFTGNECSVPIISNVCVMEVGVYAGNLQTTTPAHVPAKKSILCSDGVPADPPPDVYNQIMEKLNAIDIGLPEGIQPHTYLATDAEGKPVWQPMLAYKEVGQVTELLPPTKVNFESGGGHMGVLSVLFAEAVVVGDTYTIGINGAEYTSKAVDATALFDQEGYAFGNANVGGDALPIENPDPTAPYFMVYWPGGFDGVYVTIIHPGELTTDVVYVRHAPVTIKKIDEEFLPKFTTKQITITIAHDGTVTSDTPFNDAWAMTDAELQAGITIVDKRKAEGWECSGSVSSIIRNPPGSDAVVIRRLQMRWNDYVYWDDVKGQSDTTDYIEWMMTPNGVGIGLLNVRTGALPDLYRPDDEEEEVLYMRGETNGHWQAVDVDVLKFDLGITGDSTSGGTSFTTDETLTLENGILSVNTADDVEADNTLPVTSAAVHAEIGNINALLETI